MRLLLIEDHVELREMTAAHLASRGFVVDEVGDAATARHALATYRYDALLIDLGLPDGCGLSLLHDAARVGEAGTPVLIVTARDSYEDRVSGLNNGADDYIVKPFDLAELEARLRAVLRRPGPRQDPILQFGVLAFDTMSRQLSVNGALTFLGRREADLLERLMRTPGRIIIKDVLEDSLYIDAVTPNALEAVVSRLRRRIGTAPSVRLETLRGVGYGLMASDPNGLTH